MHTLPGLSVPHGLIDQDTFFNGKNNSEITKSKSVAC